MAGSSRNSSRHPFPQNAYSCPSCIVVRPFSRAASGSTRIPQTGSSFGSIVRCSVIGVLAVESGGMHVTIPTGSIVANRAIGQDWRMTPIATFPTLDDAESALDWIGLTFAEVDGAFEGELAADDRELLDAAVDDADTPDPIRELARSLRAAWDAAGTPTLAFAVGWSA